MKTWSFGYGEFPYILEAVAVLCGKDISISVGGGEKYHIGAVAVALPADTSAANGQSPPQTDVICLKNHREDEIAKAAAIRFSRQFHCTVSVSVGIHIDNATADDILRLVNCFERLMDEIGQTLQAEYFSQF